MNQLVVAVKEGAVDGTEGTGGFVKVDGGE